MLMKDALQSKAPALTIKTMTTTTLHPSSFPLAGMDLGRLGTKRGPNQAKHRKLSRSWGLDGTMQGFGML